MPDAVGAAASTGGSYAHPDDLQAAVEQLRAQFPQTRTLYREVCALMFYRFGITPTASRLYQLVRKGSMGVPAEELSRFWQDLRQRARVELPAGAEEVPQTLREQTAAVLTQLWTSAQQEADSLWQEARAEADAAVQAALETCRTAQAECAEAKTRSGVLQTALQETERQLQETRTKWEESRRDWVQATQASQQLQQQVESLQAEAIRKAERFQTQWAEQQQQHEAQRVALQAQAEQQQQAILARSDIEQRRLMQELDQSRQRTRQLETQRDESRARITVVERDAEGLNHTVQQLQGEIQRWQAQFQQWQSERALWAHERQQLTVTQSQLYTELTAAREALGQGQRPPWRNPGAARAMAIMANRRSPGAIAHPAGSLTGPDSPSQPPTIAATRTGSHSGSVSATDPAVPALSASASASASASGPAVRPRIRLQHFRLRRKRDQGDPSAGQATSGKTSSPVSP